MSSLTPEAKWNFTRLIDSLWKIQTRVRISFASRDEINISNSASESNTIWNVIIIIIIIVIIIIIIIINIIIIIIVIIIIIIIIIIIR